MAEGALPEREPHPRCFHGLVTLIARLGEGTAAALPDYIRWEAELLTELGYGLDLARCALTGGVEDLTLVSPRTGRAVSAARRRALGRPAAAAAALPAGPVGPGRASPNAWPGCG